VLDAWDIYKEGTQTQNRETDDESETMNDEEFQLFIDMIDLEA
jgi:hypothetical protein